MGWHWLVPRHWSLEITLRPIEPNELSQQCWLCRQQLQPQVTPHQLAAPHMHLAGLTTHTLQPCSA